MSFSLTQDQLLDGSKTVTRRLGWAYLQPGDRVRAIDKHNFRVKGGSRVLGVCEILSVRREPLSAIEADDVVREGFPDLTPGQFVAMFCAKMRCGPGDLVTRIEFRFEASGVSS